MQRAEIAAGDTTPPFLGPLFFVLLTAVVVPGLNSANPPQFTSSHAFEKQLKQTRSYSIALENDTLECTGVTSSIPAPSRYVTGVYNPSTKIVTFHESPLISLTTHVKRFKRADAPSERIGVKNIEARNTLGQVFGTRKKRLAIKALEDNKIGVESVAHVAYAIQENIQVNIASIPTREEMKRKSQSDRPIPPYDIDATRPDQVYDILDIASAEELALLPYKELAAIQFKEELKEWLGQISPSVYVLNKMNEVMQSKGNAKKIKYLLYLAYLLAFASIKERSLNKIFDSHAKRGDDATHPLHNALGFAPDLVIESILDRFTEKRHNKDSVEYKLPDLMKDKLIAYIFTVALIVEDYSFIPLILSKDLSLTQSKADQYLKEIGCQMVQTKKADSPTGQASKSYTLRVPLKFPTKTR